MVKGPWPRTKCSTKGWPCTYILVCGLRLARPCSYCLLQCARIAPISEASALSRICNTTTSGNSKTNCCAASTSTCGQMLFGAAAPQSTVDVPLFDEALNVSPGACVRQFGTSQIKTYSARVSRQQLTSETHTAEHCTHLLAAPHRRTPWWQPCVTSAQSALFLLVMKAA